MFEFFMIIFVSLAVLILSLWKIINLLLNRKGLDALPYLIIFLGFGTILVSIFFPGGFEGMAIGGLGFIVGIMGVIWLLVNIIIKKVKAKSS